MNTEAYLELVHKRLDATARLAQTDAVVPDHWLDYFGASSAQRLSGLHQELRMLEPYLPRSVADLAEVCIDAFLVQTSERGVLRVLVRQLRGQQHLAYSRCPTGLHDSPRRQAFTLLEARAPRGLPWLYRNLMDGLVDSFDLTGFVPSDRLYTMAEIAEYQDYDWYPSFAAAHDPAKVIEILSSGGGAYFLLDLNRDLTDEIDPPALRISSKEPDWTPDNPVDFWPYLDAWIAIGLAEK